MMLNKFRYGVQVGQLADEYCLSEDTVKKIVYSKKHMNELVFHPDIDSAKEYNDNELLEEWIHTYLLFERKNKAFSDGLYKKRRFYLGPMAMPVNLFRRSSGPEEGMKWRVDRAYFEYRVQEWRQRIRMNQFLPPVIVGYADGGFEINCNSPLHEAFMREKITYFPVIVWCTKEQDYKDFQQKYLPNTDLVLK